MAPLGMKTTMNSEALTCPYGHTAEKGQTRDNTLGSQALETALSMGGEA